MQSYAKINFGFIPTVSKFYLFTSLLDILYAEIISSPDELQKEDNYLPQICGK